MDDEGELIDADYLLQQEYREGYAKGWEDATSPVPAEREAQVSDAIESAIRALRAPIDGWKGELERIALDKLLKALRAAPVAEPSDSESNAYMRDHAESQQPAPQEPELKKAYNQGYTQANLDAVAKGEMKW